MPWIAFEFRAKSKNPTNEKIDYGIHAQTQKVPKKVVGRSTSPGVNRPHTKSNRIGAIEQTPDPLADPPAGYRGA